MKKLILLAITLLLLFPSILFAKDEFELGIALTPIAVLQSEADKAQDQMAEGKEGMGILNDFVLGFHAGYSFAWLFYVSIDANAMPPWYIASITGYDDLGNQISPIVEPGFVTYVDVGLRPTLGNLILMLEWGVNHLYIRGGGDKSNRIGVNTRMGVGWKFDPFSVSFIATFKFDDFKTMEYVFDAANNDEEHAKEALEKAMIPSIVFYIHL